MLAWMDLEMTGLDPERHVIVEMATLVTDDDLNMLAEGPDLVIAASSEQLDAMEDIVRNMHSGSGLLAEIEASTRTLDEAVEETLGWLASHIRKAGEVPLCGNSIGVDRRFLRRYAPALDDFFHYRSIDVSTLKELCKRWRPDLYTARPHKQTAHRALDDVKESVAELAYYREHFIRAAPEPASGTTISSTAGELPAQAGSAGDDDAIDASLGRGN